MPSFDIVSAFEKQELKNAVDQANRELATRFDFKGKKVKVEYNDSEIVLIAEAEFQTRQMLDILQSKLVKRGIDVNCLELKALTSNLSETRQHILAREGIDKDLGRDLIKIIKKSKLKVQAQMQDDQLRVTGKSRNVLQDAISAVKDSEQTYPLQFKNFRDQVRDLVTRKMNEGEANRLRDALYNLETEHRDLDLAIETVVSAKQMDQLLIKRMKVRKLRLKDQIERLKSKLIPDLNAQSPLNDSCTVKTTRHREA